MTARHLHSENASLRSAARERPRSNKAKNLSLYRLHMRNSCNFCALPFFRRIFHNNGDQLCNKNVPSRKGNQDTIRVLADAILDFRKRTSLVSVLISGLTRGCVPFGQHQGSICLITREAWADRVKNSIEFRILFRRRRSRRRIFLHCGHKW